MKKSVKVFALSTCIHCKHCKEYLDERSQPYECVYVDKLAGEERKNTIEEIKKVNPTLSFPTVMVGDKVIVGFDRQEIDKALEE
jgi:glutaredoxin